jgi:histidine phosphotransferase ChpT
MYTKSPDLTAFVGSRICHDLASPLGAISNGLELLELSGVTPSPELALLNDSIKAANARVEFFRVAFGSAASGAQLGQATAQQVLAQYFADRRVKPSWEIVGDTPRATAKLLFLLIQCLETGLPYGGNIAISSTNDGWIVTGTGRTKTDSAAWQAFVQGHASTEVYSGNIQFQLASLVATQLNFSLIIQIDDSQISVQVLKPARVSPEPP